MLATSRENRDAAAVGRDVDVLGDVGAVEQQRVVAGLALDRVAAVAGIPLKMSLPAPSSATSLPRLPSMKSSPSPPMQLSAPWPPMMCRCRRRRRPSA